MVFEGLPVKPESTLQRCKPLLKNCLKVFFVVKYTYFLVDHCASWKENMYICVSTKRLGMRLLSQWSRKAFFHLGTLLTSAGDALPESTKTQSTDTAQNLIMPSIFTERSCSVSKPSRDRFFISLIPVENWSLYSHFYSFSSCF